MGPSDSTHMRPPHSGPMAALDERRGEGETTGEGRDRRGGGRRMGGPSEAEWTATQKKGGLGAATPGRGKTGARTGSTGLPIPNVWHASVVEAPADRTEFIFFWWPRSRPMPSGRRSLRRDGPRKRRLGPGPAGGRGLSSNSAYFEAPTGLRSRGRGRRRSR